MKTNQILFRTAIALALTNFGAAQESLTAEIESIDLNKLKTPQLGDQKPVPRPQEWLETEIQFVLSGKASNDIAKAVQIEFFVVLSNGVTLHRVVGYENIALNKPTHASVYISPASRRALRIGSNPRVTVTGVAIEIKNPNGDLIGNDSTNGLQPTDNRNSSVLRKKSETPFAPLWWDRYAEETVQG